MDTTSSRTDTAISAAVNAGSAPSLTDPMRALIARQQLLMLATCQPDGSAHVVPVVYLFEQARFLVATSSASRKARNVAARPRVTVTIEDREATAWVWATGTAELLRGPESREINHRLDQLWMTDEGLDAIGPLVAAAEDVTIAITPHRWRAWDFESGFLAEMRAAGVPLDDAARWFRS